jgi:glycosyltransferase involved in cell wall biosynthesis
VIAAAGVVVPAHDEADLLPACLAAVRLAAGALAPVPVHLVVVADACRDQTAALARAAGATVLEIGARRVGAARAEGMREVLRRTAHLDPGQVWLASTDADTVVPPCWLARQARYAAAGWDAVVGTVTVADWTEHPPDVPPRFLAGYLADGPGHPHVHGANLGCTARAYLAAGGFAALRTAEDHRLVSALAAAGSRILRTTGVSVVTSARRRARAPHGFSQLLSTLAPAAP